MLLKEFIKFSKQNWWIYCIIAILLPIVYINGKGNILEIFLLIFFNLIANIFVMGAIGHYSTHSNKTGALFHVTATTIFTGLGIYGFLYKQEIQYLLWQVTFILAAVRAATFYNLEKDLRYINPYFIGALNILFLIFFIFFGENYGFFINFSSILMALGFSFSTTGLVSTNDTFRYWCNYIGLILVCISGAIGSYQSYTDDNLNGLYFGYFILSFVNVIYNTKLLPRYLKK